jgi:hypothetical protein
MAYTYDLHPGVLIESDAPLSVDDIEAARAKLDEGKTLAQVARSLDVRVYEPPEPRPPRVGVDLEALLDHVDDDQVLDTLLGVDGAREQLEERRRR